MGKKQKPSASAAGVAMMRAIEAQKTGRSPDLRRSLRPCADTAWLHVRPAKVDDHSGLYDRMAPGAVSFLVGRERYIDDFLKTCLSEGLDQVVLLGAGYDTRPLPHPRNREDARVRNRSSCHPGG